MPRSIGSSMRRCARRFRWRSCLGSCFPMRFQATSLTGLSDHCSLWAAELAKKPVKRACSLAEYIPSSVVSRAFGSAWTQTVLTPLRNNPVQRDGCSRSLTTDAVVERQSLNTLRAVIAAHPTRAHIRTMSRSRATSGRKRGRDFRPLPVSWKLCIRSTFSLKNHPRRIEDGPRIMTSFRDN